MILGALAVFAGPALAQDVVDEPRYAPSLTGESGGWDLLSGKTVPQGQWSFGLYYNNVDRVFEFNDEADADWHSLRVSLGYGLSESFELSLMLPYDDIDADIPGGGDPLGSGLGNARLGAKWRVTGTPDSDTSLAINAFAELPTGDEDDPGQLLDLRPARIVTKVFRVDADHVTDAIEQSDTVHALMISAIHAETHPQEGPGGIYDFITSRHQVPPTLKY